MNRKSANRQPRTQSQHRLKPVYAAVFLAFAVQTAQANPVGGSVVNGSASFATSGNTLTVTNTPGTIINWQGFSIGSNETTRFAQQSASSAVLNRVIGNDPSNILGTLQSNGRVFLINPNGILFGAGAVVDVAGLVASTLKLSDADFLAGNYHFTQVSGAGNISNSGNISAQDGGQIYLIAPNVENTGVITAPNGEILLAAGYSVDLVSTSDPDLRVNITAPAGDATNVGQIIASSGSLGLFGTVVRNSGTVSADSATMQGGKIVFKASQLAQVGGTVSAIGATGGSIQALGNEVQVRAGAVLDASGANGGGTILIGGDAHGANPNVQNAQTTYVDATATIKADATQNGNGGKVVVWSDNTTQFNGNISAQGGALSGNGGWVEVSGKQKLGYAGLTNTLAAKGITGSLLLDPFDFIIAATGGDMTGTALSANLGVGNVTITTALTGGMGTTGTLGDIIVNDVITKTTGVATTLTLNSYSNIAINAPITSTVGVLNIALNPGITQTGITQTATISANVDTFGGTLSVAGSNLLIINAGTTTLNSNNSFGNLTLTGTGVLTGTGNITVLNNTGGNNGVFTWTGGTLSGTGTFATTALFCCTANFPATATTMNGTLTLDRPFINNGAMSQGAGALNLTVTPAGSLTNSTTGTLILGNGTNGGSIIVNGILSNLGGLGATGTGISSVDASGATIGIISNDGMVAVAAGSTLNWTAGQTAISAGVWNIGSVAGGVLNLGEAAGAPVGTTQTYSGTITNNGTTNFTGGTNNLTNAVAITGAGDVAFNGGSSVIDGTFTANSLTNNLSYPDTTTLNGAVTVPTIAINGGTLVLNGTVSNITTLTLTSYGVLDNAQPITVATLQGYYGQIQGLGGVTVNTALDLSPNNSSLYLSGTTLTNKGVATLGVGSSIGGGPSVTFTNANVLDVTGAGASINSYFNNTGTVNIATAADLSLGNGAISTTPINLVTGAGLTFGNGTYDLSVTGAGNVILDGVTTTINGAITANSLSEIWCDCSTQVFDLNGVVNVTTLTTSIGILNLNSNVAGMPNTVANLDLSMGGMLDGLGNLTVTNSFTPGSGMLGSTFTDLSITQALGNFTIGGLSATSSINLAAPTGLLTINSSITAPVISAHGGTGLTLDPLVSLTASGAGNAVVLDAGTGNFINNSGSSTPITTTGPIEIYSTSPASDALNGMVSNYLLYNCTFAGGCPASTVIPAGQVGFYYSTVLANSILASAPPTVINEIVDISNQKQKKPEDVLAVNIPAGDGGNTLPICN